MKLHVFGLVIFCLFCFVPPAYTQNVWVRWGEFYRGNPENMNMICREPKTFNTFWHNEKSDGSYLEKYDSEHRLRLSIKINYDESGNAGNEHTRVKNIIFVNGHFTVLTCKFNKHRRVLQTFLFNISLKGELLGPIHEIDTYAKYDLAKTGLLITNDSLLIAVAIQPSGNYKVDTAMFRTYDRELNQIAKINFALIQPGPSLQHLDLTGFILCKDGSFVIETENDVPKKHIAKAWWILNSQQQTISQIVLDVGGEIANATTDMDHHGRLWITGYFEPKLGSDSGKAGAFAGILNPVSGQVDNLKTFLLDSAFDPSHDLYFQHGISRIVAKEDGGMIFLFEEITSVYKPSGYNLANMRVLDFESDGSLRHYTEVPRHQKVNIGMSRASVLSTIGFFAMFDNAHDLLDIVCTNNSRNRSLRAHNIPVVEDILHTSPVVIQIDKAGRMIRSLLTSTNEPQVIPYAFSMTQISNTQAAVCGLDKKGYRIGLLKIEATEGFATIINHALPTIKRHRPSIGTQHQFQGYLGLDGGISMPISTSLNSWAFPASDHAGFGNYFGGTILFNGGFHSSGLVSGIRINNIYRANEDNFSVGFLLGKATWSNRFRSEAIFTLGLCLASDDVRLSAGEHPEININNYQRYYIDNSFIILNPSFMLLRPLGHTHLGSGIELGARISLSQSSYIYGNVYDDKSPGINVYGIPKGPVCIFYLSFHFGVLNVDSDETRRRNRSSR